MIDTTGPVPESWQPRELTAFPKDTELSPADVADLLADHGLLLTVEFEPGVTGRMAEDGSVAVDPEPSGFVAELHTPDYLTDRAASALIRAGRVANPSGGTLYAQGGGNSPTEAVARLRRVADPPPGGLSDDPWF